ncbi:hypothetical protein [Candidatus Walczuchella monophlebidarum]|uniref:hypothetical protein n=1 Tax=Candidatus Walczuchella monophlebidarum TaxID=1415657 RepID=UPI00056FB391|nr:hypothetical protein [Candidatus Walczuchella monophlebidarum]
MLGRFVEIKDKDDPLLKHQHRIIKTFDIQYDGKSISIQEDSGYCADEITLEQVIELIKKQRKEMDVLVQTRSK